jgi:hypothetical protein
MILITNFLFSLVFFTLVFYYFKNFSYFLTHIYPFAIFFGGYITIGSTGIHVAEIFTILLLLKKPFIKKSYNQLDFNFILFFSLSFIILTFNSSLNFLYFKTILRFFEIIVVYFIYSKYSSIIRQQDIHKSFSLILIVVLTISAINLWFISIYDSHAWMKILVNWGYIPKNIENYGYIDSWSANNSVQGNYLVEHQYGIMLVSSFYLSLARKKYLIVLATYFFLFLTIQSATIQISFLLSIFYYHTFNKPYKILLYLFLILIISSGIIKYLEELNLILNQIIYLFQYGKIVEITSGFIRLYYIIEGFSHPSFNWLTGLGLNIFNYDIHPHEMLTYFYLIYGLPSALMFILIFYNLINKTYINSSTNNLLKSYFLFAFFASFGVNYFTSIVTFFPFILFSTYPKFIND